MTALSADRPSLDPNEDLFGHAPFAASLAKSIRDYPGTDGLVLALYGPWGSGKSTVLSYVRYYLEQGEENDQPLIVPFNPWWFDQSYWTNVFHDGIDALIKVPRDVVRFTNTLAVTYPAVRGEVNPVDFIALEALRVFLPSLYAVIRTSPEMFTSSSDNDKTIKSFHKKWVGDLPEELRSTAQGMLERLFPRIGGASYGTDWLVQWRRNLRVCHPDLFMIYFRLAVPPGTVRRSDIQALLSLAQTPAALGGALIAATREKRSDGLSKARALLERIMDHVESDIPAEHVPVFINVLLDIGDDLVLPSDAQGFFDFGNESRVTRVVYHLLKRIEKAQRLPLLKAAISKGHGMGVQCYLLVKLLDYWGKETEGGTEALIDGIALDELKTAWLDRLRAQSGESQLLAHKQLTRLLAGWSEWAEPAEVRAWCESATSSDNGLLAFLSTFCSHTKLQTMGDRAVRLQPRLNPQWLEKYIDTSACALRLVSLQQAEKVPALAQEAVSQFLIEFELIKAGKNPDGFNSFND